MKNLGAVVLAFSFSASSIAQASESPAPAPMAPPAAIQAPPPAPPSPRAMVHPEAPAELAEERPSSGIGYLVTGGIFTGIGALNLLTAPICTTDLIPNSDTQKTCLIASLAIGGTFLAIGVPLLIVGGSKRSTYKQWKADHPVAGGFGFSAANGGGGLTFGGRF